MTTKYNFVNYFSSKSKTERKRKIIEYRNRKYNDYSKEDLKFKIYELENKEKNSRSIFSIINVTLIASVGGIIVYICQKISIFILIGQHVTKKRLNNYAISLGQLVDIGFAILFAILIIIMLVLYNNRKNDRAMTLLFLKNKLDDKEKNSEGR